MTDNTTVGLGAGTVCAPDAASSSAAPSSRPLTAGEKATKPEAFTGSVCVIGLGYIGLPTAVVLANAGVEVFGVDVNERTLELVAAGELPFHEPGLSEALRAAVDSGRLTAGKKTPAADAYIVAVPTPCGPDHQPDISMVLAAVDSLTDVLGHDSLVIIESTVPPGTADTVARRIAAARPDLVDERGASTVLVAHVPERVLPGKIMAEIASNDRISGGVTARAAARARDVYATFSRGQIHLTDATTAEMCKLSENAFRDVNIAFANELSVICDSLGTDVRELIRLANRHPRVNILSPGAGVGGHCIAVDPWFIVAADPRNARLIRCAREVNDAKPFNVVDAVLRDAASRGARTVAVLGLAFKPDVDDVRESPAQTIAKALIADPAIDEVVIADPHVHKLPAALAACEGVSLVSTDEALERAEVVCLAVAHTAFKDIRVGQLQGRGIIDACGVLDDSPRRARTS